MNHIMRAFYSTANSYVTCPCFFLGAPDPPNGLSYNDGVVIESSVDLQWTRPSYSGGVVNYTISSTNGTTVTVENSSEVVQSSPGLVYGEVQVSAINTCGLESQPATINIPAKGMCCKY